MCSSCASFRSFEALTVSPLQRYLVLRSYDHRAKATTQADKRLALTHETVGGLSAIKLQAWQAPLAARIQAIRAIEVKHLRRTKIINAIDNAAYSTAPLIALLLSYVTFSFTTDRAASAATIFSSALLFQQLSHPFVELSRCFKAFVDAAHALSRVDSLLQAERRQSYIRANSSSKAAVSVHASFAWPTIGRDDEKPSFTLRLDLDLQPGELVAVTGAVASGKSAICAALTDCMALRSGSVNISGSVVSVGQHAYIMAGASIRDQITFGLRLDRRHLDEVLHSTCLDVDLQLFEHGEQTVRAHR